MWQTKTWELLNIEFFNSSLLYIIIYFFREIVYKYTREKICVFYLEKLYFIINPTCKVLNYNFSDVSSSTFNLCFWCLSQVLPQTRFILLFAQLWLKLLTNVIFYMKAPFILLAIFTHSVAGLSEWLCHN